MYLLIVSVRFYALKQKLIQVNKNIKQVLGTHFKNTIVF